MQSQGQPAQSRGECTSVLHRPGVSRQISEDLRPGSRGSVAGRRGSRSSGAPLALVPEAGEVGRPGPGGLEVAPGVPSGIVRARPGWAGVGAGAWPRRSRTAWGSWVARAVASSSRSQAISPTTVRRGPRASTVPRTRSRPWWKTVWAHRSWESSKKARSTSPLPSSRVTKMIRRPDAMGGGWVEARTSATRTRCPGASRAGACGPARRTTGTRASPRVTVGCSEVLPS